MFRIIPALAGILTAATVLLIVLFVDHREGTSSRNERIHAWLAHAASLLESELLGHLQLVRGLEAFVRLNENFTEEQFQAFAGSLEGNTSGIRSLQLQPGAVIRHVTKRERNRGVIGHDLLADPERREGVLRAIRQREFMVNGPVEMVQGGVGVIARMPIYTPDPSAPTDRFWGFATIVLQIEALLSNAQIRKQVNDFQIAMRGRDGTGAGGEVFFGDPEVFKGPHLMRLVSIPNGTWVIGARPVGAWPVSWSGRTNLWYAGVPLAAALGLIMFGLLRWPQKLRQGIDRATAELRRLNDRLQEGEAHYRTLYEHTPVMMHSLRRSGCISSVSDHWLEKLGYTREEVMGRHITEFLTEDSARFAKETALPRVWRAGRNVAVPFCFVSKTGEVIEVELSSILDPAPTDGAARTLAVLTDVTERNRAQRLLAEKNKELERANEGLRQFALVASHDLQEPLRKIGIFSSMLEQEIHGSLSIDGQQALTGIIRSARRLSTLVSDMLKYSRTGNADYTPQVTDLGRIIEHVLNDLALQIEEADAHVEVGPLPSVMADPTQATHLFQNLISNALKYRVPGRPCRIEITADRLDEPDRWEISVKDNGIGFRQEHARQIWQPFHRLHTQSEYAGSGIGLAICAKIAERHHWHLRATAEPGKGATFNVEVPAAA